MIRVGSKASLSDLAAAAEKAGYKMEKTGANEAYIALIKRVLEQGDTKDAEKAANDLLKKSTKAGMTQTVRPLFRFYWPLSRKPLRRIYYRL